MPNVLRADGYRFFFYSDEGNPREPPHIHVVAGEKIAKFWLDPVELAKSKRLSASEIGALHRLVTTHRDILLEAWHAYFNA
jgi:hypothetical protein